MKKFSTEHLRTVFAEENKYENFRKLCYDLNHGNEIFEYDEDGNKRAISKKEANKAVRKILMEVCDLNEDEVKSPKKRKRAIDQHYAEMFELIEEDIDFKVATGLQENEWFNQFVETRNVALGDDEVYWTKNPMMFVVAEVSGDHHDLTAQYLNEATQYRVPTKHYGIAVQNDIDLILLGRIDFTEFTDKIAESFAYKVQELCYTGIYSAASSYPMASSQFVKSGTLVKATWDKLIQDVATANNSDVVIMGTKVALKNLNDLAATGYGSVDWRSDKQKQSVNDTGLIGSYEGVQMIEIPQRFKLNDTTVDLIDDSVLMIFATGMEPFVKFTDKGETEILERGIEKGDRADDTRYYEVQREFGVGVTLPRYFGYWDI